MLSINITGKIERKIKGDDAIEDSRDCNFILKKSEDSNEEDIFREDGFNSSSGFVDLIFEDDCEKVCFRVGISDLTKSLKLMES